MSKLTLGIDMGGTGIKMGLVTREGKLSRTIRLPTPVHQDPEQIAASIAQQAQTLIELAKPHTVIALGVGCAGDIDPVKGLVRVSPNLRWKNVPLKALLSRSLKLPILIDNDANVAAWAAYVVEARQKVQNLLCVTVGTGVGGGLVLNGQLYHGATGSAGELGHMTLFPEGSPCPCGNQGCTERYVGAKAMSYEARHAIESGEKTSLKKLIDKDYSNLTPHLIHKAARSGDRLAQYLWDQAGERLGITLASTVNLLNPEWIVFAGGLSRSGNFLLDPVRRTILKRSFQTPAKAVRLVISKLDQDLGMVGAGLLAHDLAR